MNLDVQINEWFGTFYDLVQKALGKPGSITLPEFWGHLMTFGRIAMVYVTIAVVLDFFIKHYIFRWRTAMNELLHGALGAAAQHRGRGPAGAGGHDALRPADGGSWGRLHAQRDDAGGLPAHPVGLVGQGDRAARGSERCRIRWSGLPSDLRSAGTVLMAVVGIKLPGLEFQNQRVEAAYRKELVYGEDDPDRAAPPVAASLFSDVRRNYFRLFFHYLYFDVVKWAYLQFGVLVPYIALGPTLVSGLITLGVMQQIVRAFGRVESSFQYLVLSWTTVVELISVFKRLRAFERQIRQSSPAPQLATRGGALGLRRPAASAGAVLRRSRRRPERKSPAPVPAG